MSDSPALTIRGQQSDDWTDLYTLLTLDSVIRESVDLPYPAEDALREQLSSSASGTHTLIAETGMPSGRKRFVGAAWVSVKPRRRRRHVASVKLIAHPEHRGSEAEHALLSAVIGLAQNWLGLRRLETTVYADQADTITLYEQHGFRHEATMRRYAFRAGAYCDAALLAWVRSETA